jgi:hypothetical protein
VRVPFEATPDDVFTRGRAWKSRMAERGRCKWTERKEATGAQWGGGRSHGQLQVVSGRTGGGVAWDAG